MAFVGRVLGPGDPNAALSQAQPGQTVPVALEVLALSIYLNRPIAVLFGALMVLWSSPGLPEQGRGEVLRAGDDSPQPAPGNPEHTPR
jgi:hypothetical protein